MLIMSYGGVYFLRLNLIYKVIGIYRVLKSCLISYNISGIVRM